MEVVGTGTQMGVDIEWVSAFRGDGAFTEVTSSSNHTLAWGWPGEGAAWEQDWYGAGRSIELDDHESLLLHMWARSGYLTSPSGLKQLTFLAVEVQPPPSSGAVFS